MMVRYFLHTRYLLRSLHIALALLLSFPAAGQEHNDLQAGINAFMADYTRQLAKRLGQDTHIDYHASSLESRANLQPCSAPLSYKAKDQTQSNRLTLQVSCSDDWSIYVPIDLDVYRSVVVTVKPLAPGSIIEAGDVELASINVSELMGTYTLDINDVVGMSVKRTIGQNRPVISQQLEAPMLIRRGDAVIISADGNTLAVKMPGTALTDGRRGEQIRIKNQASSRVVDARVVGPGAVTVPM